MVPTIDVIARNLLGLYLTQPFLIVFSVVKLVVAGLYWLYWNFGGRAVL